LGRSRGGAGRYNDNERTRRASRSPPAPVKQGADPQLQEILVTAARRTEPLSKVPLSITAVSQDQMDQHQMEQSGSYTVFSVPGWGSALAEAMLALCCAPVRIEDVTGFDRPGAARDRLLRVNPLGQVPALLLPDGEVITESAAIALLLSERHPQAGLAPAPGTARRPAFLRRLIWIAANVYPTFTYGDYPDRWVGTDPKSLTTATDRYRERLWREFESEVSKDAWSLGAQFSALDIYVAVMTHWKPERAWFAVNCPRLSAIASRADEHSRLKAVLQRNFPSTS